MKFLRTLAYAAIILALLLVIDESVKRPGFLMILSYLRFASFIPFSLACAAAINGQRGIVVAVVLIAILSIIPCSIETLAHAVVPIGVGILAGEALRIALHEAQEDSNVREGKSVPR